MEIIHNVSQLNREGVSLLAASKERKALQVFSRALQMITDLFDADQLRMVQQAEQQAHQLQRAREASQLELMEVQEMDQVSSGKEKNQKLCCSAYPSKLDCVIIDVYINKLEDERFFIYNNAIVFHPPTLLPFSHLDFYNAVILYNMALCYHRRYLNTRKAAMQDMACRLYDGCCESMKEYMQAVESSSHKLLIIALNNQGQLFFDISDKRYKIMAMKMTEIVQYGLVQEIQSELVSEMLLNILMCGVLLDAGTAAA